MTATAAIALDLPENYPEDLTLIAHIVASRLARHGMAAHQAAALAFDITEALRADVGGANLYIPMGVKYEMSLRDAKIYSQYNGHNLRELAHEYDLSEMQMRTIIKRGRSRDLMQRQGALKLA